MSKIEIIPLGELPKIFEKHGVSRQKFLTIMTFMMSVWKDNEEITCLDLTKDCIDILGLDSVRESMLTLEAIDPLVEISKQLKLVTRKEHLAAWTVKDRVVLLEIDN